MEGPERLRGRGRSAVEEAAVAGPAIGDELADAAERPVGLLPKSRADPNELTPEVQILLASELQARGIRDRETALQELLAADLARYDATERVAPRTAARTAVRTIGLLALLVPAFVVGCGSVLAPLLWTSSADRDCQNAGFWYATYDDQGRSAKWRRAAHGRSREATESTPARPGIAVRTRWRCVDVSVGVPLRRSTPLAGVA